jgi:hypothetical protein
VEAGGGAVLPTRRLGCVCVPWDQRLQGVCFFFFPFFNRHGTSEIGGCKVRAPFFSFFLTGKELLERCRQRMDAV